MSGALSPVRGPIPSVHRIAQLIETGGPGGAERVLVNLTRALNTCPDTTASVVLLKEGWLAQELRRYDVEPNVLWLQRALDPLFLHRLKRSLAAQAIDLIHAHEFTMNVYGAVAGRWASIPVVATVHGKNYYAEAGRRVQAMRVAARLGARVVAVSADIQAFLEDELDIGPVEVIANGIDVGRYRGADPSRGRRLLGVPDQAFVVGAVGNLYAVKGHRTLLEAVALLDDPTVHVVIAGRGEEEEPLRRRAETLGLVDRLHLLGFRDDVPDFLCGFDVYALPSHSEGQSLALIEAMAARLPIVASRVGGNPEIVVDGESGLLLPAEDAPAWAHALGILKNSPERRAALARAAAARALECFSLQAMVGAYRRLYAECGLRLADG